MSPDPNRICPFCMETVQAKAKVCPRCRQWLSLRSLRNPVTSFLVTGIPFLAIWLVLIVAGLVGFDRVFNPRPHYSELPDALQVLELRMNWVDTTNGPRLYITGILTNQSAVPWRDIEFECRFFDSNGVMVDADTAYGRVVTVQPHDDSAFRVAVMPSRPASDYATLRLSVNAARNARAKF